MSGTPRITDFLYAVWEYSYSDKYADRGTYLDQGIHTFQSGYTVSIQLVRYIYALQSRFNFELLFGQQN